jgi:hypothetical protein
MAGWRARAASVLAGIGLWSCAAHAHPLRPAVLPADQVVRRESLDLLARTLFQGIRERAPERVLAPVSELDALLPSQSRARIERERSERPAQALIAGGGQAWSRASYAGFCAQGAREEPPGGVLGLSAPAWSLDRLLVVADVGGGRSASWVEGRFLFTDRGWRTLSLSRVEPPRAGHSDLDLAPCDVEQGIR